MLLPEAHKSASSKPQSQLDIQLTIRESSTMGGLLQPKGELGKAKGHARVGDEGGFGGVPSEGADAELQGGEPLRRVAELEVPHVVAVELEGVPPGSTRDAAHLQVKPHERGLPHALPQLLQRLRQVPPRHLLHGHPAAAIAAASRRRRR